MHLRLLASPTCVGLRYGRPQCSPLGFSSVLTRDDLRSELPPSSRAPLSACAYWVERQSTKTLVLRSTVPQRFATLRAGPEFSPAFHRLRLWGLDLGSASPCADCHGAGILRLTVRGVFTRVSAYSVRHPHFWSLQDNVCHGPFTALRTLPYPCSSEQGQASAGRLIPTILGASTLDE